MKGDFTRDTFDPDKHFLRVLMQQGRVQVDADWNEQVAILLYYMQTLAADLIGPHGGPAADWGFEIKGLSKMTGQAIDFAIGKGRYYVDGILCENGEENVTYEKQPDYPKPPELETKGNEQNYLVYLDVWERHISHLEDELIREVALGGTDTATRAKVVWQAKVTNKIPPGGDGGEENIPSAVPAQGWCQWVNTNWSKWLEQWQPKNRGHLKAKGKEDPHEDTDPCIVSPESRFRGAKNQLYRVEIHSGGKLGSATFKWSRDNGSVVSVVKKIECGAQPNTTKVTLTSVGSGCEINLAVGDWVEIIDDDFILLNKPGPLRKIIAIDQIDRTVTLDGEVKDISARHPLLRRWDFKPIKGSNAPKQANDNALLIEEGKWLTLENGVQIWFEENAAGNPEPVYRTGDYWLIPARVETGDIEWPEQMDAAGKPLVDEASKSAAKALSPRGVLHHYAPLAILSVESLGGTTVKQPCRCKFEPLECKAE